MSARSSSSRVLMPLIIYIFTLVSCSLPVPSGSVSGAQMAEANQLYEAGRFAEAASSYQALVDAGVEDGRLFYNLGNAYFKTEDLGRAVLYYQRALRLLPRDGDVVDNLELARALTLDRIDTEHEGAIVSLVRRLIGMATVDEAALTTLVIWILLCALAIGAVLWRKGRRVLTTLSAVVAILFVFGIMSLGIRLINEHRQPLAVVVGGEVALRSGPGEDYLTEFTLHAGAEVRVLERRHDWVRVALPGDLQGWAHSETIIAVIPSN